jgi:hypothetical protein
MKTTTNVTSSSRLRLGSLALIAAVTLAFAPQSARADKLVPFHAVFNTAFESTVNGSIMTVHVTGVGNATHLGLTSIDTNDQTVDLTTGQATATYYFTAANGDEIVLALNFFATPTPTGVSLSGHWDITSGTGRFADPSGSGTFEGRADFTGADVGVGRFTMTGMISSPGKSK